MHIKEGKVFHKLNKVATKKSMATEVALSFSLKNIDSFGDVSAEEDAVLDYFLNTEVVGRIQDNSVFVVLGRKGSGKTALVRHFAEGGNHELSKALNLRGYPWTVHSARKDHGASDIEAYVSSWRYLIAVELASLVLKKTERPQYSEVIALKSFMQDNYGSTAPRLQDVLRPPKLNVSKLSIGPKALGLSLGSIDLDRKPGDFQFGYELNSLSHALLECVYKIASNEDMSLLLLHFDELDQGLSTLDENRKQMLIGLVLAAREVRKEYKNKAVQFNPVVYLRTDIWNEMEFSDKNKITQGQSAKIEWTSDSLLELVNLRLRAKLGLGAKWEDVINDELMRGSQPKWNHIISKGFLRPRDVIRFLNAALGFAKRRGEEPCVFCNKDIVDARESYSNYLKDELDDEILPHWPYWTEALQSCSAISTITFTRDMFEEHYNSRKSESNPVDASEALELLYGFSVVGYERRSGYGGTSWAFEYTSPEAGYDSYANRFKVHIGLKEHAKLREKRA